MQNVFLRVFQTPVVIVYSPIIVFLHGHFEVLVFGDRVRGFVPWEPILLQDDSRRRFVLAECRPDRDCVDNLMFVDQASQTRSEEHTSELQSLMRISYAVFCLKKKKKS